jgi:4-amino-4-deoxy-L-arabinose transferase-like glycosyltransferase
VAILGAMLPMVALALVLRLVFYFGLVNVDPFSYADAALSIGRWQPALDPDLVGDVSYTQYIRLTIVAPAALWYRLLGASDTASTLTPILLSLSLVAVGCWFGHRIGGLPAAVATGFFLAIYPVAVVNSTQFLPDAPQGALVGLAAMFLVAVVSFDLSPRRRALLAFAAGASCTLAFYARGTAVAALLPLLLASVAIAALQRRWLVREALSLAAGALAVLALFQILLVSLGSSPFEDFRLLIDKAGSGVPAASGRWDYARLLLRDAAFWPFVAAGAAGGAAWLVASLRRRSLRTPLIVLGLMVPAQYIYFEFFMSLEDTPFFWKEPRYLLPMMTVLLIVAGVGSGLAFAVVRRRGLGWPASGAGILLAVLFVLVSVREVRQEYDFWVRDGNRWDRTQREVAAFLDAAGAKTVFSWNEDFSRPLSFRLGGAGTFYERTRRLDSRLQSRFDERGVSRVTPGSFVVVLDAEAWWAALTAPARHWRRAFVADGVAVYEVPADLPADEITIRSALEQPVPLDGDLSLTSAGISQDWLLPGEHLGIELQFDGAATADTEVRVALRCGMDAGPATALTVPRGASAVRSDILLQPPGAARDCLVTVQSGGREVGLLPLRRPVFERVEAEGVDAPGGDWVTHLQARLSGGTGLVATAEQAQLAIPIHPIDPGAYWVSVRLWAYDRGPGTVSARLGGVEASAPWSLAPGQQPGPVDVSLYLPGVSSASMLTLTFNRGSQPAVFLDGVVVSGVAPPR